MAQQPHPAICDLLDILPDAVLMVDDQGQIVYANAATQGLLGYAPIELVGQPLSMLLPPGIRALHAEHVARFQRSGVPTMMGARPVLRALHRSGRPVPVSIAICNFALEGEQRVSVAVLHNVALLHTHLDRATVLAETDPLTGLGNRLRLSRSMQAWLATERPFALLFMDLQRFKPFNDLHGHAAGDEALRIVGQRLAAQVRGEDLVARLGGDEFVVLLDALDDAAQLAQRATALQESVTSPLRIEDAAAALGVNIGGALCPRHGRTEADLLAAADRAMYEAKAVGAAYRLAAG